MIRIEDQIFNDQEDKYRVATVVRPVVPSQETQDSVYDQVSDIVSNSRSIEELQTALEAYQDVTLTSSEAVKANDFDLGGLGPNQSSRDIITWMYESTTEPGDVSPEVYRYTDNVNYYDNKYVIAALERVNKEGLKAVEDVRAQIETLVLNKKKGEKLASEMNVSSLEDLASQYNVEVQNAADVTIANDFVAGVGSEPEVIAAAFSLTPQSVSKPIVGNSGVFVISPLSVNEAGVANNIPFLKRNISTSTKSQVSFKILQNMKERANIKDNRATFF